MSKAGILSIGLIILVAGPLSAQWFQQNSGLTYGLLDVDFVDTLHGVVTGIDVQHTDTALVTTNGGNTWLYSFKSGGFGDVCMVNDRRGWAVAGSWFVTTTDGGFTWVNTSPLPGMFVKGLSFVDTLNGWAAGEDGGGNTYIYATTDGGYNWSRQATNLKRYMNDIQFVDTLHGWACGYDGGADTLSVLATRDGGQTWVKQRTPSSGIGLGDLFSIFFLDSLRGWGVCSADGQVIITTDGGQIWDQAGVGPWLYDIVFADSVFGWAVGSLGGALILVSTDGGWNWSSQPPGVTNTLAAVDFVGRKKGWIVGLNGVILHTDNGGGTVGVEDEAGQGDKGTRGQGERLTAYPNPSAKEVRIQIKVPEGQGRLAIYDITGRLVRDLTQKMRGSQVVVWDGRDEQGRAVTSGSYFVKLRTGEKERTRKVVILR